jgi:hypothetical protein
MRAASDLVSPAAAVKGAAVGATLAIPLASKAHRGAFGAGAGAHGAIDQAATAFSGMAIVGTGTEAFDPAVRDTLAGGPAAE